MLEFTNEFRVSVNWLTLLSCCFNKSALCSLLTLFKKQKAYDITLLSVYPSVSGPLSVYPPFLILVWRPVKSVCCIGCPLPSLVGNGPFVYHRPLIFFVVSAFRVVSGRYAVPSENLLFYLCSHSHMLLQVYSVTCTHQTFAVPVLN
jgi:hypothetical protein